MDGEPNYPARVNGVSVTALVDSGASHISMSPYAVKACGLQVHAQELGAVPLADGSTKRYTLKMTARIAMKGLIRDKNDLIAPLPDESQIIIGDKWLRKHKP